MTNKIHLLRRYRKEASVSQHDVATLLDIKSSNLARYESEKRIPTPEVLLTYHTLFGVPIAELLAPLHKKVRSNMLRRSQRLIPSLIVRENPKSRHRVSYLKKLVKRLNPQEHHDG